LAEGREKLVTLLRSRAGDREVTIYVKGFLGRGEKPDHFEAGRESHRRLTESHGWGSRAYGYAWESGRFERLPLPAAAVSKLAWDLYAHARRARRFALMGALGVAAAEQLVRISARLTSQYLAAARSARERAEHLAQRLSRLSARYDHVRVVGHSLGCVQVIEAAAMLDAWERPAEIHLCAPACREREVAGKLDELARQRTWLYYTGNDLVLATAFRLMARGRALGSVGPRRPYSGLESLDVSPYVGLRAHGEYKSRLPEFAGGHRRRPADRLASG
jgi:hypothetical protein